jgi:glutamine amidotransferase
LIVIIDYESGNVGSIRNMLNRLRIRSEVSRDRKVIADASAIILPGIGAFDTCAANLRKHDLVGPITEKVRERGAPALGVCVGAQLMMEGSEEGDLPGFGWFSGHVKRFRFPPGANEILPVPHMGWNEVSIGPAGGRLFSELGDGARFYFVHSYHFDPQEPECVAATANYGLRFCAAMARGGISAVQFHPEKSHKFGMKLYANFAREVADAS